MSYTMPQHLLLWLEPHSPPPVLIAVKLSITELFKISRKWRKRYNGRLLKMQMWSDSSSTGSGATTPTPTPIAYNHGGSSPIPVLWYLETKGMQQLGVQSPGYWILTLFQGMTSHIMCPFQFPLQLIAIPVQFQFQFSFCQVSLKIPIKFLSSQFFSIPSII